MSETVLPYAPLALKELLVNALVHRDYETRQPVLVEVWPTHIRIANPGGLVEDVFRRIGLPIQQRIERGERGLKGYRNPVIADLFYGSGVMDKAGSGLPDVHALVRENGGTVVFGPTANNEAFEVIVYCRPESVDPITGTAVPVVTTKNFISNLLEVVTLPEQVWHAATSARRVREVWEGTGADTLPAFLLSEDRLFSFSDLTDEANPLASQIERHSIESLTIPEFASDADGERRLVNLLNETLYRHLERRGLAVDKRRKRAYFPRTEVGSREITYQARLRRATRTVTKAVIWKTTQNVRYWEHEGFKFGFERYANQWAIQIVPGYIFTLDGRRKLMEGPKVGPLSTKRAARDYNPNVLNDLVFWSWVLSAGEERFVIDDGYESRFTVRGQLTTFAALDLISDGDIDPDLDPRLLAELEQLEDHLGQLAEEEQEEDE